MAESYSYAEMRSVQSTATSQLTGLCIFGSTRDVTVIVEGSGQDFPSSNTERGSLHFT